MIPRGWVARANDDDLRELKHIQLSSTGINP